MREYIKLSEYAKRKSITYRTAWNHFKSGKLKDATQDEFGNILIQVNSNSNSTTSNPRAIIYARVSNNNRTDSLVSQQQFLESYSSSKSYEIVGSYKEIASGMNDNRKQLQKILTRDDWDILVVEHKDRLTRFGFNYIKALLNKNGKEIEVVNVTDNNKDDLMNDLISIIYSFSARLYGKRRGKRKDNIKKFLEE